MDKMLYPIFKHTLRASTICNITVKTSLIVSPVNREITVTKRKVVSYMSLLSIAVIGPGFKLMSPVSITITLKYDLCLFRRMLDTA